MPQLANAQVIFSEIMYDAPGSDSNHEWIEIQNSGAGSVDISGLRLKEGTTNHTLLVYQGTTTIPGGGYAVIVKDPGSFLADHPNFTGAIFDSTFSLSNTGESLTLKDNTLADIDSLSYTSSDGANGNGQTLQKIDGTWKTGNSTPGALNVYTPAPVKEVAVPVTKKSPTKTTTASASSKKLSASKVQKALDTPADSGAGSSAAIDLSTLDQNQSSNDSWKWYVGLGALVVVAIGGIFALKLNNTETKPEYEIVE